MLPPPPPTPIIFVVLDLLQRNFVQVLTVQAPAQIWKNLHKINDVIDDDVFIVRKLAEKTIKSLKRFYFRIATASSSFIQSYVNFTERLTVHVVFD